MRLDRLDIPLRDVALNDTKVLELFIDNDARLLRLQTNGAVLDGPAYLNAFVLVVRNWARVEIQHFGEVVNDSEQLAEIVITDVGDKSITLEGFTQSRNWVQLCVTGGESEIFGHKDPSRQSYD